MIFAPVKFYLLLGRVRRTGERGLNRFAVRYVLMVSRELRQQVLPP
jgi:hypothetical protein